MFLIALGHKQKRESMNYFIRAVQHYIIEIVISIIKLFMGYGLSSFDIISYRQYLKDNNYLS